jgi:hypothetical protein
MSNAARSATRWPSLNESRRDEPGAIGAGNAPLRAPNSAAVLDDGPSDPPAMTPRVQ